MPGNGVGVVVQEEGRSSSPFFAKEKISFSNFYWFTCARDFFADDLHHYSMPNRNSTKLVSLGDSHFKL